MSLWCYIGCGVVRTWQESLSGAIYPGDESSVLDALLRATTMTCSCSFVPYFYRIDLHPPKNGKPTGRVNFRLPSRWVPRFPFSGSWRRNWRRRRDDRGGSSVAVLRGIPASHLRDEDEEFGHEGSGPKDVRDCVGKAARARVCVRVCVCACVLVCWERSL